MIWKRYLVATTRREYKKGTKFIGQCIIPSLIFPASSFQLIDFHCWFESCSSAVGRSLHFSFAHFFCLLSTPVHVCVTTTNLNCLLSEEWYTFCTMGHEIQGGCFRQPLHKLNFRVYSQIPLYTAFIVGFYSISDLKAYSMYGSQLSFAVYSKTGREEVMSDLSENSWCHSTRVQNKYHLKVHISLSYHTIQKFFFIQQSYEIFSPW